MERTIVWLLGFFLALSTQAEKTHKALSRPEAQPQPFQGLKLKGQVKKPAMSYTYQRTDIRSDAVIQVPNDFNSVIHEAEGEF